MDTRIQRNIKHLFSQPSPSRFVSGRSFSSLTDIFFSRTLLISSLLLIASLLPRLLLAFQLDMVTDEVVYITGGKIVQPFLTHLKYTAVDWNFNYEHPPFVKMLIGATLYLNHGLQLPLGELQAARIPSICFGTLLVLIIYWLGRDPFGEKLAVLAALCLAFSPWLAYFSSLAYLDMTMTTLITLSYLLLWHALQRPWLYLLSALCFSLALASKYTALLITPALLLFPAYFFLFLRSHLPIAKRPTIPWLWWASALLLIPVLFLAIDPAIWSSPLPLLLRSMHYEWLHAQNGHLTFLAGQPLLHVPWWTVFFILFVKISLFVVLPALFFVLWGLYQLFLFHRGKGKVNETLRTAFLLIWLLSIVITSSQLNIVVGTHYHLPAAPPVILAGTLGLAQLLHYRPSSISTDLRRWFRTQKVPSRDTLLKTAVQITLSLALLGPHLFGLVTTYASEGYTSEFFQGEDSTLQVSYPAYREALHWITEHTEGPTNVGLVAIHETLVWNRNGVSWAAYNKDIPSRLHLQEVSPDTPDYHPENLDYDYLVWPMHMVQRGFGLPSTHNWYVVHEIRGGKTIYCMIVTRTPKREFPSH